MSVQSVVYKNTIKSGKQVVSTVNKQLISTIKKYLNTHQNNTFLLESKFGEPLMETQLVIKI